MGNVGGIRLRATQANPRKPGKEDLSHDWPCAACGCTDSCLPSAAAMMLCDGEDCGVALCTFCLDMPVPTEEKPVFFCPMCRDESTESSTTIPVSTNRGWKNMDFVVVVVKEHTTFSANYLLGIVTREQLHLNTNRKVSTIETTMGSLEAECDELKFKLPSPVDLPSRFALLVVFDLPITDGIVHRVDGHDQKKHPVASFNAAISSLVAVAAASMVVFTQGYNLIDSTEKQIATQMATVDSEVDFTVVLSGRDPNHVQKALFTADIAGRLLFRRQEPLFALENSFNVALGRSSGVMLIPGAAVPILRAWGDHDRFPFPSLPNWCCGKFLRSTPRLGHIWPKVESCQCGKTALQRALEAVEPKEVQDRHDVKGSVRLLDDADHDRRPRHRDPTLAHDAYHLANATIMPQDGLGHLIHFRFPHHAFIPAPALISSV